MLVRIGNMLPAIGENLPDRGVAFVQHNQYLRSLDKLKRVGQRMLVEFRWADICSEGRSADSFSRLFR